MEPTRCVDRLTRSGRDLFSGGIALAVSREVPPPRPVSLSVSRVFHAFVSFVFTGCLAAQHQDMCIQGTNLLRQSHVMSHRNTGHRLNLLSYLISMILTPG